MRIVVRVTPGAGQTRVGGRYGESEPPVLAVRITAPAVDGKANDATVIALARAFGLPRGDVRIVRGSRSRTKIVELKANPEGLASLLAARER